MLGKVYVNPSNEFLTTRGYNKLKNDNVLKHFTTKITKAKIFKIFVDDTWPLSNTHVFEAQLVSLYVLKYRTEEHLRPWVGDIMVVNNELDKYQVLSVGLDENELNVYKLLAKKL